MKRTVLMLLAGLTMAAGAWADGPMEAAEIIQVFEQLCQQPSTGWIEQGQIEAAHRSSDFISGKAVETHETVVTNGNHFCWKIQTDSYRNGSPLNGQKTKDFLQWNQDRTFVWDGLIYSLYFKSGNHAIVYEEPSVPVNVTGPLKAGHIPWGHGMFSFESLSAASFSANKVQTEDGLRIQLSVQPSEELLIRFILDPDRNNAVISYTLLRSDGSKIVQSYGNFTEHLGRWIPMNILIDRYDHEQLLASDSWEIVSVQNYLPEPDSFAVSLKDRALVERHSPLSEKPLFYRHSGGRDIESLLEKRYIAGLKKGLRKQNCGTIAIEQIFEELGVSVSDSELEPLIDSDSGDTTLYQIHQLTQKKGLFCLPVKTSISGLTQFKNAQVLLHFPNKKHFVVLDRIDKDSAWIVDLDRQTFYHNMKIARFEQEWAGIALVISDQPLSLGKDDRPIPDPILKNITGSADYSCSELIQADYVDLCPEMKMGRCGGEYTMWYERFACQRDADGGYCDGTGMIGSIYSNCSEDSTDPGQCSTTGDYVSRYIRACQP